MWRLTFTTQLMRLHRKFSCSPSVCLIKRIFLERSPIATRDRYTSSRTGRNEDLCDESWKMYIMMMRMVVHLFHGHIVMSSKDYSDRPLFNYYNE